MLHEVLLSLLGHTGDVIVESGGHFVVSGGVQFIAPGERGVISHIITTGERYKKIASFAQQVTTTTTTTTTTAAAAAGNQQVQYGLYVKALCNGLEEVLDSYRSTVLSMEQKALQEPDVPLTYILQRIAVFELVFPALVRIVDRVQQQGLKGGEVLNLLSEFAVSGDPSVRSSVEKLQVHCHRVLYSQLSAWLLHGLVVDPHREFFIVPEQTAPDHTEAVEDGEGPPSSPRSARVDCVSDAMTPLYDARGERLQFSLLLAMVPSYVSMVLAEKILFIGRAVRVLNHPNTQIEDRPSAAQIQAFIARLRLLQNESTFQRVHFEATIEDIRRMVAKKLWHVVMTRAHLQDHLHALKNFFFLSTGDLWLGFVEEARAVMLSSPITTLQHDLNGALQRAASTSSANDDPFFERIQLVLPPPSQSKDSASTATSTSGRTITTPAVGGAKDEEELWGGLGMQYRVEWPIHLLITPDVVQRYAVLFRFLISVKRAQVELKRTWTAGKLIGGQMGLKILQLRHEMGFLVDNLFYYLQADVIEPQYRLLEQRIAASDEFDNVKQAHEMYLAEVSLQCFHKNTLVAKALNETLVLCLAFANRLAADSRDLTAQHLDEIFRNYQRQQLLLFTILTHQAQQASSPFLSQLLLRLDYNGFLSSALERMAAVHQLPRLHRDL